MEHITVLLIEDNPGDARLLSEMLTDAQAQGSVALAFDVVYADRLSTGLERFAEDGIDVVLLDLSLPDSHGLGTLASFSQRAPDVPIVVLTGLNDDTLRLQAVQQGAQDYLVKGHVDSDVLVHAIRYAIERQQMHLALQASEARFRRLIASNADGVILIDRDGVIRFVNPAAEALFARRAEELLGTVFGLPVVLHETAELDIIGRHDERAVAEMRVVETEWEGDQAYLASLRDISERKRAEEILWQREEQLRQAQKMEAVGRLAGGVAHEFNNLLTAIIGYSDILLLRLDEADVKHRYVERISTVANRAALLTRQLLAFSRRESAQPRVLDGNAIVADTEKMLRPLIGEDIDLVSCLASQLGNVKADPTHLQQLLMNLVVNARDAMPQGGKLTITTANVDLALGHSGLHLTAPPGPYVMMEVCDTGIGMDAEVMSHLFEPFFTTKEIGKGTGLGLAVVYGILQQCDGDIEVRSEPGHGTTFKVYLPRVSEAVQPDIPRTHAESPSGSETILLVEDEQIVRVLLRDALQLKGYRVLEAADARTALHLCAHHDDPIHLLVTDVVLPEMNGRELAQRLAALCPEMRVLFISGHAGDAIGRHGMADAHIAFLQKPFTPDHLASKVREVLDASSA